MYLFGVLNDLLIVAQMQGTQRMSYVQVAGAREATMIEALYSVIAKYPCLTCSPCLRPAAS